MTRCAGDDIVDRQLGTAVYLIDFLALRVGGEKDTEEEVHIRWFGCSRPSSEGGARISAVYIRVNKIMHEETRGGHKDELRRDERDETS